jgi:hypothetical protein
MFDPDFHPKNRLRTVDWRWQLAGAMLEADEVPSRCRHDPWVHRAFKYRRAYDACETRRDKWDLCELDPAIYWAHDVWRAKSDPDADEQVLVACHGIEARLLATQPYAAMTARVPLDFESIEAFEKLFFNVEGRHDELDYIAARVMGPAYYRGVRARQYDLLWKVFGWGLGPEAVDMFVASVPRGRPVGRDALNAAVADGRRDMLKALGLVAARTLDVGNPQNAIFLTEQVTRLEELEMKGGREAATGATALVSIQGMMTALPFRVGTAEPPPAVAGRKMVVARLADYDAGGAELRGDELTRLGAGMDVPEADHMRLLAFPPPRARAALSPPTPVV